MTVKGISIFPQLVSESRNRSMERGDASEDDTRGRGQTDIMKALSIRGIFPE